MKNLRSLTKISLLMLLVLSMLVLVPSAQAFDGRSGDTVVIPAGEVVEDNLYVGAEDFVLDGEIKGDLFVGAKSVVINGRVDGDLFVGAESIIINGDVTGDVRVAGANIVLGSQAKVGSDAIVFGYSLNIQKGNTIQRDLLFGGYQATLAGDLGRNLFMGGAALDLQGHIGGNARIEMDVDKDAPGMVVRPWFGPGATYTPTAKPGLIIADTARIDGDLHYTSRESASVPSSVVGGGVTHTMPAFDYETRVERTPRQVALSWFFDSVRTLVGLLVVGLLLAWLAPAAIQRPAAALAAKPLPSLGWGMVALVLFPFALVALFAMFAVLALVLGALTLGDLLGAIITIGSLVMGGVIVSFGLIVGYLSKLVVAYLIGRWIMRQIRPDWTENVLWAVVLGVLVVAIPMSVPYAGWAFGLLLSIFGLGALVVLIWNRYRPTPAPVFQPNLDASA